ncbi:acetylesterase, partial [bacterium]|nr:acetylesterase [bacterium]
SKMATAAHAERENGHTGNFFNITWALMGVSRSGPNATGAYLRETAWYYDLARRWDGSFVHQGIPGQRGDSYRNWDCTGAYLLAYAVGRKSLTITGKTPSVAPALTRAETAAVIDDGRHFTFWDNGHSYDHMTDEQLLGRLASWSPIVRHRAARSLVHHEGEFTARLVTMLGSGDRFTMYGACEATAHLGPRASGAAPKLRALLASDDPWMLTLAVNALAALDEATRKSVAPDLLKLATRQMPADPRRMAQRAVAAALFSTPRGGPKGLFVDSLAYDDPHAVVAAVASILANEDGRTRGLLTTVFANLKDDAQLAAYLPAILEATRKSAPSGIMFADGIRMAGLDLLSRMRIREGMAPCIEQMEPDRWAQGRRIPRCLASLGRYGGNARPLLPQLQKVQEQVRARRGDKKSKAALMAKFDETIKAIKDDKDPPKLRSAKDIMHAAK